MKNDFVTVRALIRKVYGRVPKGWDSVGEIGQPYLEFAPTRTTETAVGQFGGFSRVGVVPMEGISASREDPTRATIGVLIAVLGCVMSIMSIFAVFSPLWAVAASSEVFYGPGSSVGSSLWVLGYTLSGPAGSVAPVFISDCYGGNQSMTMDGVSASCGAMLSAQIFSLVVIISCVACFIIGLVPEHSIRAGLRYPGLSVALFAVLCFGLYFGSTMRLAFHVLEQVCTKADASPATCHADAFSVSFWIMVALVPVGTLHAWTTRWRHNLYKEIAMIGITDGPVLPQIDKMNTFLKKVIVALMAVAIASLIAGIVLGASDKRRVDQTALQPRDTCSVVITDRDVKFAESRAGKVPRVPGTLGSLSTVGPLDSEIAPRFFPVGDVNKDLYMDFIVFKDPLFFTFEFEMFLVWGQRTDQPLETVDFSQPGPSTKYVRLTLSLPSIPLDAVALGDVTGDGIDDFLLVFSDGNSKRATFLIPGTSGWDNPPIGFSIDDISILKLRTTGFLSPYDPFTSVKPFFTRISIGADLDGDGIADFCTTSYKANNTGGITFGFCMYGVSDITVQRSVSFVIDEPAATAVLNDTSLGFALTLPQDCWHNSCYYDVFTTKSMIGNTNKDDLVVAAFPVNLLAQSKIFVIDGQSRSTFGGSYNPLVAIATTIDTSKFIGILGYLYRIVPLGDMGQGPVFAAVCDSAGPDHDFRGFALITLTPTSAPTIELGTFPRIKLSNKDSSSDYLAFVSGGNVVPSLVFDYDLDGQPDLILTGDYGSFRVLFNHAIVKSIRAGETSSSSQVDIWTLDGSSYRDIKVKAISFHSTVCGKSELCFGFEASSNMMLFSAGVPDPLKCSAQYTPSLFFRTSPSTRTALGIFGFLSMVILVLAGLHTVNKKVKWKVLKMTGSKPEARDEVPATANLPFV